MNLYSNYVTALRVQQDQNITKIYNKGNRIKKYRSFVFKPSSLSKPSPKYDKSMEQSSSFFEHKHSNQVSNYLNFMSPSITEQESNQPESREQINKSRNQNIEYQTQQKWNPTHKQWPQLQQLQGVSSLTSRRSMQFDPHSQRNSFKFGQIMRSKLPSQIISPEAAILTPQTDRLSRVDSEHIPPKFQKQKSQQKIKATKIQRFSSQDTSAQQKPNTKKNKSQCTRITPRKLGIGTSSQQIDLRKEGAVRIGDESYQEPINLIIPTDKEDIDDNADQSPSQQYEKHFDEEDNTVTQTFSEQEDNNIQILSDSTNAAILTFSNPHQQTDDNIKNASLFQEIYSNSPIDDVIVVNSNLGGQQPELMNIEKLKIEDSKQWQKVDLIDKAIQERLKIGGHIKAVVQNAKTKTIPGVIFKLKLVKGKQRKKTAQLRKKTPNKSVQRLKMQSRPERSPHSHSHGKKKQTSPKQTKVPEIKSKETNLQPPKKGKTETQRKTSPKQIPAPFNDKKIKEWVNQKFSENKKQNQIEKLETSLQIEKLKKQVDEYALQNEIIQEELERKHVANQQQAIIVQAIQQEKEQFNQFISILKEDLNQYVKKNDNQDQFQHITEKIQEIQEMNMENHSMSQQLKSRFNDQDKKLKMIDYTISNELPKLNQDQIKQEIKQIKKQMNNDMTQLKIKKDEEIKQIENKISQLDTDQTEMKSKIQKMGDHSDFRIWVEESYLQRIQRMMNKLSTIESDWELIIDIYRQIDLFQCNTIQEILHYAMQKWMFSPPDERIEYIEQKPKKKKEKEKKDPKVNALLEKIGSVLKQKEEKKQDEIVEQTENKESIKSVTMFDYQKEIQQFEHTSPIILQILKKLKDMYQQTKIINIHTDEQLKMNMLKQLSFLELFAFNNLNLVIIENALGSNLIAGLFFALFNNQKQAQLQRMEELHQPRSFLFQEDEIEKAKQKQQAINDDKSSGFVLEKLLQVLSIILRYPGCAGALLNSKAKYIIQLLKIINEEENIDSYISVQGIIIIRQLLQTKDCHEQLLLQFPQLDQYLTNLLKSYQYDYHMQTNIIFCKYLIAIQGAEKSTDHIFKLYCTKLFSKESFKHLKKIMMSKTAVANLDELIAQIILYGEYFFIGRTLLPINCSIGPTIKIEKYGQVLDSIKRKYGMLTNAATKNKRLINQYNPRISKKDFFNLKSLDSETFSDLESSSDENPVPYNLKKKKAKPVEIKNTKEQKESQALSKLKDAMKLRIVEKQKKESENGGGTGGI